MRNKAVYVSVVCGLLAGSSCNSRQHIVDSEVKAQPETTEIPKLRTEYWPPDLEIRSGDTVVAGGYRLQWATSSLNDSALVDTVQDERGKLLTVAHNYQTELRAWENGTPLFTTILSKSVFGSAAETQPYGWHFIDYRGYRAGEFIFLAGLYYPDSDVGKSAEVAIDVHGNARVVKMLDATE